MRMAFIFTGVRSYSFGPFSAGFSVLQPFRSHFCPSQLQSGHPSISFAFSSSISSSLPFRLLVLLHFSHLSTQMEFIYLEKSRISTPRLRKFLLKSSSIICTENEGISWKKSGFVFNFLTLTMHGIQKNAHAYKTDVAEKDQFAERVYSYFRHILYFCNILSKLYKPIAK